MKYVFQIQYLDIHESYFKGGVRLMYAGPKATKPWRSRSSRITSYSHDAFTINIQDERRGKVLRLPFPINTQKRVKVTVYGYNLSVEDYVEYRGESEWVEIDSTPITF